MAVNQHDHALVIGISRYTDAATFPELNGPNNDAADVAAWLQSPTGGGLPHNNVRVVRSACFPNPANIGPLQQAVVDEFTALRNLPNAYKGRAGRRLYVYVSGHGMAAQDQDAAVITAEATKQAPLHVLITDWYIKLWYAARFKEYALWVDTCVTRRPIGSLTLCPWDDHVPGVDLGLRFNAFAVPFGKIAVEAELDGQWHGVFTYALLQGLTGAGGTPVTSENLRKYLNNSLRSFIPEKYSHDRRVGTSPGFGVTDDLVFATPPQATTFAVTLRFPQEAVGKQATISVDASSPLVEETVLQEPEWKVELEAGSYAAYVPELDRSQGFTVTGGGLDEVVAVL